MAAANDPICRESHSFTHRPAKPTIRDNRQNVCKKEKGTLRVKVVFGIGYDIRPCYSGVLLLPSYERAGNERHTQAKETGKAPEFCGLTPGGVFACLGTFFFSAVGVRLAAASRVSPDTPSPDLGCAHEGVGVKRVSNHV
jgi:hypothetical protein